MIRFWGFQLTGAPPLRSYFVRQSDKTFQGAAWQVGKSSATSARSVARRVPTITLTA
jgi:hypothetical protein